MKTTHTSFNISFVTGPPGSGKSFCMIRDVIERLSGAGFNGKIITNLPINLQHLVPYIAKVTKQSEADIRSRIILIPRETIEAWQDGVGGPWDYAPQAKDNDFILDECHLFCRKEGKNIAQRNERWTKWLGEVRHEEWRRIVFVTQDESKVGKPITQHAELRFELTNAERLRDPLFKIPLSYWYELFASITGEYRSAVYVTEYRRRKGKLVEEHSEKMPLDKFYFQFYHSYSAAGGGSSDKAAGTGPLREFQRRPRALPKRIDGKQVWPTWAWVLGVHWWRFALAGAAVGAIAWLTVFGGTNVLLNLWMDRMKNVATSNAPKKPGETKQRPSTPTQVLPGQKRAAETGDVKRPHPIELAEILGSLDEEKRLKLLAEFEAFREETEQARQNTQLLRQEIQRREKLVKVVALTKNEAWFSQPDCSCKVGEILDEGPYKGKRVRRIDLDRLWVELDGGVRLWVGRGAVPDDGLSVTSTTDQAPGSKAGSEPPSRSVPRSLQPVPTSRTNGNNSRSGTVDNDFGSGDALRSLLQTPSPTVGPVDRRGGQSGNANDNDGNPGSTDRPRPVPGS